MTTVYYISSRDGDRERMAREIKTASISSGAGNRKRLFIRLYSQDAYACNYTYVVYILFGFVGL